MQYPLYVNRTRSTTLNAHFSDFPDVDLIGQPIAAPTRDTELRTLETVGEDGLWLYVDIDLARVASPAVEFQFSVSDSLLRRVDAAARARQMTRAEFFSPAATRELQRERTPQIPPAALIAGKRSALHIGSKS